MEISENFFVSAVTEDEIGKIICNFKDSAAEWDDLRPSIMKLIQSCIKRPCAHIYYRYFMTGVFLSELKLQMLFQYSNLVMIWYFPTTGLFLCYLYCQKYQKDLCIIDLFCTSISVIYYMNISLDFRRANPLIWL